MPPTFVPRYVGPGFYVKQKDISTPNVPQGVFIPAIIGLVFLGAIFGVFTFHPPRLAIFQDSVTGGFGIP